MLFTELMHAIHPHLMKDARRAIVHKEYHSNAMHYS